MGKIPELREQKSHGAAKDSLEQRGVREKGEKKKKEMNILQIQNNPPYLSFQQSSTHRE